MIYAVIETGGHQLCIEPGGLYDINKLSGVPKDTKVFFNRVLLVSNKEKTIIGQPIVKDVFVEGKIVAHQKAQKIIVYKMRPKKKTRRKYGHRQTFTRFLVEKIHVNFDKLENYE